MANKMKYTVAQMSDALRQTKGMVYVAAQRLGCDANTVLRYCKRYPTVEAVKQAARGELLDEAELRLWAAVQRNEPGDQLLSEDDWPRQRLRRAARSHRLDPGGGPAGCPGIRRECCRSVTGSPTPPPGGGL